MSDAAPNPELLHSLGRLARGLSALFWGLPAVLIASVYLAKSDWLALWTVLPLLLPNIVLLVGLWQIGFFQKQERPWRNALDRARLLALVNLGLCPFIFWHNRLPEQSFFSTGVNVLELSGVLFLFDLNLVLARLAAMLPDETLRQEARQFTGLNRVLLVIILALLGALLVVMHFYPQLILKLSDAGENVVVQRYATMILILMERVGPSFILLFALLPLSTTMALIWKTKEVILENLFSPRP